MRHQVPVKYLPNSGQYRDPFVREIIETTGIGGTSVRLGLAFLRTVDYILIVLSELPDNPGTTVTNMIELLAARVMATCGWLAEIPHDRIAVVEHYSTDYHRAHPMSRRRLDFDLVQFDEHMWNPEWQPVELALQDRIDPNLRRLLEVLMVIAARNKSN